MQRGADLAFLSAFPGEAEVCFPPLTFLKPTGLKQAVALQTKVVTVIEMVPHFAS